MADTRRKSVKGYLRLNNCRIPPEAYLTLNRIAGTRSLAVAIEELCKWYELAKLSQNSQSALSQNLKTGT